MIAFVLGSFIERNVALTAQLVELGRISFFDRPAAMIIAALIVVSFVWMAQKKGQAMAESKQKRFAGLFGLGLAGLAAILLFAAISADRGYGAYAFGVSGAALALCALAGLRDMIAARSAANGGGETIPAHHTIPLVSLGAMVLATVMLGLPLGVGVMVAVWFTFGSEPTVRRLTWVSVAAVGVAVGTALYLDRIANVIVPDGLLIRLLF